MSGGIVDLLLVRSLLDRARAAAREGGALDACLVRLGWAALKVGPEFAAVTFALDHR